MASNDRKDEWQNAPNAPSLYPQVPPQGFYAPPQNNEHGGQYNGVPPMYQPAVAQPMMVQGQPVYVQQPASGNYYTPQQVQVVQPHSQFQNPQHYPSKTGAVEMQQYRPEPQYQQPEKPLPMTQPGKPGAGETGGDTASGAASGGGDRDAAKCQDAWAAVLFLAHLGFIAYLAFARGLKALRDQDLTTDTPTTEDPTGEHYRIAESGLTSVYIGLAVVLGAAAAWSALWTGILLRNAAHIITAALIGSIISSGVGVILALVYGNFVMAIMAGLMGAIQVMWYYCVRDRIPFASMNLKCSATATLQYPSILFLAAVMTVVQMGWALLWQLAAYGVAVTKGAEIVVIEGTSFLLSQCTDTAGACACSRETAEGVVALSEAGVCKDLSEFSANVSPLIMFLLFISLFWGSLVVKNVLFCSAAGMVADWWYSGQNKGVVSKSFFRASSTSFGSICFGSLILAVLRALRQMLHAGRRQGQRENALTCVVNCLMAIIERLMQIFNRYAMVYCATYGTGFRESGTKTFELFKRAGLTAIINDDLAETALNLVALIIALLTAVVGFVYGTMFGLGGNWPVILAVVGFFAGFFVSLIVMSVLDAGVATVFVVFAEDPQAFAQSHPALYEELAQAWAKIGYDPARRSVTRV